MGGRNGSSAVSADAADFRRLLRDAIKAGLCCWQAGHVGRVPLMQMHDALLGLLGVLTSATDLAEMWAAIAPRR